MFTREQAIEMADRIAAHAGRQYVVVEVAEDDYLVVTEVALFPHEKVVYRTRDN